MLTRQVLVIFAVLASCMVFSGCHKQADSVSGAFSGAPPEIKAAWDQAVADDHANNYVAAVTGYHTVMEQKAGLTDEQIAAVNAAALAINQRLYAAAARGDAAAKDASFKLAQMQAPH